MWKGCDQMVDIIPYCKVTIWIMPLITNYGYVTDCF